MSTQEGSFFRRLDVRFPWLKLVATGVLILIIILDLLGLTISNIPDTTVKARVAPMSRHVRARKDYSGKKLVALTFDDGPSSATTPRLLDILYEKDVMATFFVLGKMTRNNPEIIIRAKKDGHVVASHTMYHQNLIRISSGVAESDISEARDTIKSILGQTPTLTRPPYGNINNVVREYAGTPLILWSVDTLDWKSKDVEAILAVTREQVYDGAIILMHDIYDTSVDAVPLIVDELRSDGYEFVTVPELAKERGVNLSAGTAYYNFRP